MTILYAGRMPANHREHPTSAEGSFGLVPALPASDCKTLTVREIRIKYQKLDGWRGRFYLGRPDRGVFPGTGISAMWTTKCSMVHIPEGIAILARSLTA